MPKPEEYKHIRAWGNYLGSYEHYIKQEQSSAAFGNAPIDAIYARVSQGRAEATGNWATFSGLEPALQAKIQAIVDRNDRVLGERSDTR